MAKAKAIAFFDFDHTIIDGDAGPRFGGHLISLEKTNLATKEGWQRWRGKAALASRHIPFVVGMATQAGLYKIGARKRSSVIRSAYRGLRGIDVELFRRELVEYVADDIPDLVFPEIQKIITDHQAAGVKCVIITTGMEELVKLAVDHIAPDLEIIGCRLKEKDGKITGRVEGPLYGADKANIMRVYCGKEGIDLQACYAYSDHWSDVEMLEAVGHPVCVNPRGKLRRHAQKMGWTILTPEQGV